MGSLQSEALHSLEYIQDALCLHPLQDRTQRTEGPRPASTSTAHTQGKSHCVQKLHCIYTRICCDSALKGDILLSSINLWFVQIKTDRGTSLYVGPTCSALWWDGFRTAAAVFAPQQLCWSCPSHQWGCPPRASRGNGTDAPLEPYSPEKAQMNRCTCLIGNIPRCCWSFIYIY